MLTVNPKKLKPSEVKGRAYRPGRNFEISDQRLPSCSWHFFKSSHSSALSESFLMVGSSWLYHLQER
jgi:hypothetical protein